jgi:hypothetical protein
LLVWLPILGGLASACAAGLDDLSQIGTVVASTMAVEAGIDATVGARVELTITALVTALTPPTPTETPAPPATATETPTLTPDVISLSVSTATNCRTGPGAVYNYRGSLEVGETSEVVGVSTEPNYYYIANPDRPGEYCWLWGEYATVVGDPFRLPVFTPIPRPTLAQAFTLAYHSDFTCGVTYAVFRVVNTGSQQLMTAERHIRDLDTSEDMFGPELDRHPFAPSPAECPPGHDNRFPPDAVAYIFLEIDPEASGHRARATIKACTEDYLGGDCYTQRVDFQVP